MADELGPSKCRDSPRRLHICLHFRLDNNTTLLSVVGYTSNQLASHFPRKVTATMLRKCQVQNYNSANGALP